VGRPGKRVTQDDIVRAFVALKEKYPRPEWDGLDRSVIGPLYQLGRSYFCDDVGPAFHPATELEKMMNHNTHMRLPAPSTRGRERPVDVLRERCFQLTWGS